MQTKQELRSFYLNPSVRKTRAKLLLRTTESRAEGIQDGKKKPSLFIICHPRSSPHSHICRRITLPFSEINRKPRQFLGSHPPCSGEHSPERWAWECTHMGMKSVAHLHPTVGCAPVRGTQATMMTNVQIQKPNHLLTRV